MTPWTVAHQDPPRLGFSRPESWSGLSFPSPGDLPDPGIEPGSPALKACALLSELLGKPIWLPNSSQIKKVKSFARILFLDYFTASGLIMPSGGQIK